MKKVIKNLKLFASSIGLATSLAFTSPISVNAEEEVLWESTKDDHVLEDINNEQPDNTKATEQPVQTPAPTAQVTIDASNWNPASEPNAGLEIPDYVQTEAERKGLTTPTPTPATPTPETPTPDTPTPDEPTPDTPAPATPTPASIPKTGSLASALIVATIIGIVYTASTLGTFRGIEIYQENKFDDLLENEKTEDEEEEKKLRK